MLIFARVDNMSQGGSSTIGLQMGSNQGANQSGMSFGAPRPVADGYYQQ